MEIEITEVWRILRQRFRLLLLIVCSAVLITGLTSFFLLKPTYDASSVLFVKYQSSNQQIMYDDLLLSQQLLKTYNEIIKSDQVANDVVDTLRLNQTATRLLSHVQVVVNSDSLLTTITAQDGDPAQAVAIANTFATISMKKLNSLMGTENVHVLEEAKLSPHPSPVSPRPYLYMAIAFLVSLVLGVGVILLMEMMDKSIKTEQQIEEMLGLSVLGVIPDTLMQPKTKRLKHAKSVNVRGVVHER